MSVVAAEIRRRLPGVPLVKLHKLLYYCQGHHAAHSDGPLFPERVSAWDHGPVVGQFWWAEKDGAPAAPAAGSSPLDQSALNTIGYVVSRYGRMTGHDLEVLSHHERPWQLADAGRPPRESVPIDLAVMAEYFRGDGAESAGSEEPAADADVVREFLAGATARGPGPGIPDTRASMVRPRSSTERVDWQLTDFADRVDRWVARGDRS